MPAGTLMAATGGFMLADTLSNPSFFMAAIATDESHNLFESSFKDGNVGVARNQYALEAQDRGAYDDDSFRDSCNTSSSAFLNAMPDASFSPMFGFSSGGASPASIDLNGGKREGEEQRQKEGAATNFAPSSMWASREKYLEIQGSLLGHSQEPSPPHSSSHSPESWPYGNHQSATPLHQLLIKNDKTEVCSVHGQITPPIRESPNPVLAGGAINYDTALLCGQVSTGQAEPLNSLTPGRASKRKRSSDANQTQQSAMATESPPKKERRRRSSTKSSVAQPNDAGDGAKRSRFLERNRLAASKCRQKKKEWTKGLEERARNLQNEKLQLQIMVNSLRSEMIFVREELLRHGNCGCERIRDYLNTEVNALARDREQLSYLMRNIPSRHRSTTPSVKNGRRDSVTSPGSKVDMPVESPHGSDKPDGSRSPMQDCKTDEDMHTLLAVHPGSESDEDMLMKG